MSRRKNTKQIEKLLTYMIGRRPDEFGLVLDDRGWIRLRDIVKAMSEEPGWGYVRKSHIHEALITSGEKAFIVEDEKIRAVHRDDIPNWEEDVFPPKLLYHCLRRRAYPGVCKQGIKTSGQPGVLLATTEELAQRMGKRRDPVPVLVTVHAQRAAETGVRFSKYGELIYVTNHIPVGCFTGPPPLKGEKKEAPKHKKETVETADDMPGSFKFNVERSQALQQQRLKRKGVRKEIAWKQDVRRLRRKGTR